MVSYFMENELKNAWEKLTKTKGYAVPKMVFHVIGDSEGFVPKPWPKSVFKTALQDAAKCGGGTWIMYRGRSRGVSKIVEEAYNSYLRMEFYNKKGERSKKIEKRRVRLVSVSPSNNEEKLEFCDEIVFTVEDKFTELIVNFEKYISNQYGKFFNASEDSNFEMRVPLVVLVVEGDLETIVHTAKAVEQGLPVVIIRGSGKAADLIMDYVQDDDGEETLNQKAPVLFGISFDKESHSKVEKNLKTIKKSSWLINCFDLSKDDPMMLSKIAGEAVVRAWAMERITKNEEKQTIREHTRDSQDMEKSTERLIQSVMSGEHKVNGHLIQNHFYSVASKVLKNVVAPERPKTSIVRKFQNQDEIHVLQSKYIAPSSLPLYFFFGYQVLQEKNLLMDDDGKTLLLEAMKANRWDYVQVLMDDGVHVNIKESDLHELYRTAVACNDCKFDEREAKCLHMQWLLKETSYENAKNLCTHREIKVNNESYSPSQDAKKLCRKILHYKGISDEEERNATAEAKIDVDDLLLWAIFANRSEIAEICWIKGGDQLMQALYFSKAVFFIVVSGLICTAVLRTLSRKANNLKEQIFADQLDNHASLFEKRCISILDKMYETDSKIAMKMMEHGMSIWDIKTSPLTFAYENFMYDIVAHTCSQRHLNTIWYNELAPDFKPFVKSMCSEPKKFLISPLSKFFLNYLLFFLMLVFYSAYVLTSVDDFYYRRDIARVFEYYVYFWGGGDCINELICCFGVLDSKGKSHRGYYSRMKRYLYDFWNLVDLLSYALLITALFVRHFYHSETFTIARRMFALSLLVMCLRFLEVFLMSRKLGPTLIMIKEMLKDLFDFLYLTLFVVLGVGLYYHANLWPNHINLFEGDWTDWRIWKIIYYPYWQLYGETFNEFLEGKDLSDCTSNSTVWLADTSVERCPQEDWTVSAVSAIYMLFSNLLLVNLVIAMFSFTFERVQSNAEKLWRFERYTVIMDYETRIPSPLNLVALPIRLAIFIGKKCKKSCRVGGLVAGILASLLHQYNRVSHKHQPKTIKYKPDLKILDVNLYL